MLKKAQLLLILISAACMILNAAEKYAILIAGDYTASGIPVEKQWNDGLGDNTEFWNDLYLQWEMLYQKGYSKENIKVLFAHGTDLWDVYGFGYIDERYRAEHITDIAGETIVNYSVTTTGLDNAISEISSTSDDFLYVWVMSHGGTPTQSSLCFLDAELTAEEFATKIKEIPAHKKNIVINANYAQDFENQYWGNSLVHLQLSAYGTKSYRADDHTNNGDYIDQLENELINGIPYYHGELSFHNYIANVGHKPLGETEYDGYNLAFVDFDGDGIKKISETYFWAKVKHSGNGTPFFKDYNIVSTPEADLGMCSHTSLEYPTMIQDMHFHSSSEYYANNFPEKRGLIGIAEDISINNPGFSVGLRLESNSVTEILNEKSIYLGGSDYGCHFYLESGSQLCGTNNNAIYMTSSGSASMSWTTLVSRGSSLKNISIEGWGFGYFDIEADTEFINSHFMTYGDGPAIAFRYGLNKLTLKENSSLKGMVNVFNYGGTEGCSIEVTDGSVVECEQLLYLDNVDLNVSDFGVFNYCNDFVDTYDCSINVKRMGTLNFMAGGNFSPESNITAISGGQVQLGERSTLNMNSANFTIESGSRITLQENSRLNTNYVIPAQTSIYAGNNSSVCGNIDFSEYSTLKLGWDDVHHITAGSVVNFYSGSKIWLSQGSELIIDAGAVLNLYGGMTIVYAGGSGITNNGELNIIGDIIETTNVMPDLPDKGELWNGIVSGVGSKTTINYCNFTGAETAISGTPAKLSVTNCTFTDCVNGIELTACNDFRIIRNTFTGKGEGAAITITQSNGWINNNTASNFYKGLNVISCSPLMVQNTITNNVLNGVYTAGYNTYPQMYNPIQEATLKSSGEDLGIDDRELNNTIYNNGINYVPPLGFISKASQLYMVSDSNIYLNEGMNNICSDGNSVPCIRTIGLINELEIPRPILIYAPENYWGSNVNDSFFALSTPYYIDYSNYSSVPYGTDPLTSSGGSDQQASKFLSKALEAELDGKYDKAIKIYEKIIEKYPDSSEAMVAYAKLPDSYTQESLNIEPLIEMYDMNIADENSNKKFFKELKVSSHIKAKNYDTAIALSEEMKLEAGTEDEIILCDIDIAIANMLKNAENKGKSITESAAADFSVLLDKLTGGEDKDDLSGITDAVVPESSKLYQNYPNPFNPVTQIRFDLAKAGNVKLSVYNVNGQKVAELANSVMNAGAHSVDFDGSNLNSGVYYYMLDADGFITTSKMVLTK